MEQQKAPSQQRNGLGIALVGRLAHILQANSFFAVYSFFLLKLPPRLARELLVNFFVMRPTIPRFLIIFQGTVSPRGNRQEVSKLEESHIWTKARSIVSKGNAGLGFVF